MKIEKSDEKEKYINYKSAKNGFVFYAVALLIWSIYSQFTSKGHISWQTTIMTCGVAVFLISRVYYSQKMNDEQNK
jgi:low affinity Fe/Cu permease